MPISDKTFDVIQKTLDLRQQNEATISSNIANASTPGYKAMKMDFEEKLQDFIGGEDTQALAVTNPGHLKTNVDEIHGLDEVFEDPDATVKNDGNSVNRERELAKLAQEQLMFNSGVTTLNKKLAMLKYAISEGGNR